MTAEKEIKAIHDIALEKIVEPLYFLEREDDLEAVTELDLALKKTRTSFSFTNKKYLRRKIEQPGEKKK